jgi:Uma2 family endonuclease
MIQSKTPTLYSGQRLSLDEFFARYEANPDLHHVELIHGVVVMPSPIRFSEHGEPSNLLIELLGIYRFRTPGLRSIGTSTLRLNDRDSVEPDVGLAIRSELGGKCELRPDGFLVGPPELIIETCGSTQDRDLIQKRAIYEQAGVKEYLVWLTETDEFRWLVLQGEEYEEQQIPADGILKSISFPGLWLNIPACLGMDESAAEKTVREGLASPEHQQFVGWLQKQGEQK